MAGPSFQAALSYALDRLGKRMLQLKPEQEAAILSIYNRKDVFMWLPTGFGKTIDATLEQHKRQTLVLTAAMVIYAPASAHTCVAPARQTMLKRSSSVTIICTSVKIISIND